MGLGAMPPAANEFLQFSHKKTHFYIEKGRAVSAVTTSAVRILQWGGGLRMTSHATLGPRQIEVGPLKTV